MLDSCWEGPAGWEAGRYLSDMEVRKILTEEGDEAAGKLVSNNIEVTRNPMDTQVNVEDLQLVNGTKKKAIVSTVSPQCVVHVNGILIVGEDRETRGRSG